MEQIYLQDCDLEKAFGALEVLMAEKGRASCSGAIIERQSPPSRDFEKHKTRYFVAAEHESDWVSLVEAGEFADWELAKSLSKRLNARVFVLSMSDAVNCWAHIEYLEGEEVDAAFFPASDYGREASSAIEADWSGEAWEEANLFAEQKGLPAPFRPYEHTIRNIDVGDSESVAAISFSRA